MRVTAALLLLLPSALSGQVRSGTSSPRPATRRAHEFAALIEKGTPASIRAYIDTSLSADLIHDSEAGQHFAFFVSQRDQSGHVTLLDIRETSHHVAYARFLRALTGAEKELIVAIDTDPPYRVTGYGIRPAPLDTSRHPGGRLSNVQIATRVAAYVQRLADADQFSGTLLVAHDGRIQLARAYGQQSKEYGAKNRVDTRFNLGSMNKMVTAIAIAQLVEAGTLSYEDTLSKFIADLPTPRDAHRIQIKHLLTHTSGLGEVFREEFERSSRLSFRTVDDMMRLVSRDSLPFAPGTQSRYSNAGFVILGKIIEIVSGRSYFDYVREHIYRPAGLTSTDSYALDDVNLNLATSYDVRYDTTGRKRYENATWWSPVRGNPSGGGYSNAPDLLRFAMAFQRGDLVSPASVRLLTSPKPELHSPDYRYGFRVDPGARIFGHGGGAPGVSANLDIFGNSGWVAIVLSNYGGDSREPIVDKIRELIAAQLPLR